MNEIELALRMRADVSDVESSFKSAGSSVGDFADDVTDAARKADTASDKLSGVGDAADNLDDKAGKATGALGALSAGFELAGMEKYATGLQSAAMATDFLSGVGQSLNLVMELQIVQSARAKAAAIAQAAASKIVAAGNKAWAATQWLVNAALSANPVGLVIIAVVALVAAVVLAWRNSEKFRAVATAAFKVVTIQIRLTIEVVKMIVGWVRDKIPPAFSAVRERATAAFQAISSKVSDVVSAVVGRVAAMRDRVTGFFGGVRDRGRDAFQAAADKARDIAQAIPERIEAIKKSVETKAATIKSVLTSAFTAPLDVVKDIVAWVDKVIDKISKIKIPDLPGIPGLRQTAGGALDSLLPTPAFRQAAGAAGGGITINIQGVLDSESAAREIKRILGSAAIRRG